MFYSISIHTSPRNTTGQGSIRDNVQHAHETSDIPLSPFRPESRVILVVFRIGDEDIQRLVRTLASAFQRCLLGQEEPVILTLKPTFHLFHAAGGTVTVCHFAVPDLVKGAGKNQICCALNEAI